MVSNTARDMTAASYADRCVFGLSSSLATSVYRNGQDTISPTTLGSWCNLTCLSTGMLLPMRKDLLPPRRLQSRLRNLRANNLPGGIHAQPLQARICSVCWKKERVTNEYLGLTRRPLFSASFGLHVSCGRWQAHRIPNASR